MVALTYGDSRIETKTVTAPRQGFFARFLAAMMESRMRQAEREIKLYAPDMLPLVREQANSQRGGW